CPKAASRADTAEERPLTVVSDRALALTRLPAIRPFGNCCHAAYGSSFRQSKRHRALTVRQWTAIGVVELPRAAKFALAYLGADPPQFRCSSVVVRNPAFGVGSVDSLGHSVENSVCRQVVRQRKRLVLG